MSRKPQHYIRTERHVPGVMNKTEERYEQEVLRPLFLSGEIKYYAFESFTIKLAPDCRYTPDFMVIRASDNQMVIHEVKGYMQEDAKIKLKMARQLFPFPIIVCRYIRGEWSYEEIN